MMQGTGEQTYKTTTKVLLQIPKFEITSRETFYQSVTISEYIPG